MDPRAFVDLLRRRNLAKILEQFESQIERPIRRLADPDLTQAERAQRARELDEGIASFKRTVRKRLGSFAADCTVVMDLLPKIQINAAAVELLRSALPERPSEETQ